MSESFRKRFRSILMGLGKAALGLALVVLLVRHNWPEIRAGLDFRSVRWGFLALGFGITLAATLLTFLRWYFLVRAQCLPFGMRDSVRIGFIGYFFNLLLPGAVGGDLVKSMLLIREQQRRTVAVATVLIDRMVGVLGLVLLAGLATLVFSATLWETLELRRLAVWTAALVVVTTAVFLALFSSVVLGSRAVAWACELPVLGGVLWEAFGAMAVYRSRIGVIIKTVLMSLLTHLGFVMSLRCAMLAVTDQPAALHVHLMIVPLGLMVGAVPITPGGIGTAELATKVLFDYAGADGALALVMMLAFRGMQFLTALVGMGYYIACQGETRRALERAALGSDTGPLAGSSVSVLGEKSD